MFLEVTVHASFEAFTVVTFPVEVFWLVTPCSVVVVYQRVRGPCCPHLYFIPKIDAAWTSVTLVTTKKTST